MSHEWPFVILRAVKTVLFKAGLALLAPALALALIEGALWAAGVSHGQSPLLRVERADGAWWMTNPRYGAAIFPRDNPPRLPPLWIPAEKKPDEIRVVVLGESAAEGFPLPAFSLARVVEVSLAHRLPSRDVRVLNLAMTAINSHQVRKIGLESLKLKPDAVILYAGNNEVIGPYGPGSVFGSFHAHPLVMGLVQRARTLRLARLLDRWRLGQAEKKTDDPVIWHGLWEFENKPVDEKNPALPSMRRYFRKNIGDLVRRLAGRGVPVVVCTMGVNLRDWPPLGAAGAESPAGQALSLRGAISDPGAVQHAGVAYETGRALDAVGRTEEALTWFRRACDLDTYRFRADSGLQAILREIALRHREEGVVLVDVDRRLHESPVLMADHERFFEHVHLTMKGRLEVAEWMAEAVLGLPTIKPLASAGPSLSRRELVERLLFLPVHESKAWSAIALLYDNPPFAGQSDAAERVPWMRAQSLSLRETSRRDWPPEQFERLVEAASASRSRDPYFHYIAGSYRMEAGRWAEAEPSFRKAMELCPHFPDAQLSLAQCLVGRGALEEAARLADEGLAWMPNMADFLGLRGEIYLRGGQIAEGIDALEKAFARRPRDVGLLITLARAYAQRGDLDRAEGLYRRGLTFVPESPFFLNNLADLLLQRGAVDVLQAREIVGLAERAVASDPESHQVRMTLARSLEAAGRRDEAGRVLEEALALAVRAGDSNAVRQLTDMQKIPHDAPGRL